MRALVIMMNLLFVGAIILAALIGPVDPMNVVVIAVAMFGLMVGNWLAYKKINASARTPQ